MLQGKILIVGGIITALMFAGCAKKRNDSSVNHFQQSNTSIATNPVKSSVIDSEDIFSEFYKDENTSIQKEKLSSKETFTPSATNGAYTPSFSQNGRYVIQISTVRSQSLAEEFKVKLEKLGYPAYIAEVQNPTPALNGTFYRIRVGAFSTLSEAKIFGDTVLKSSGYDYWIDYKSNDLVGIDGNSFGNSGSSYISSPFTPETSDISNSDSQSSSKQMSNTSSDADIWTSGSSITADSKPFAAETVQTSKTPSTSGSSNNSEVNKDSSSDWGSNGW